MKKPVAPINNLCMGLVLLLGLLLLGGCAHRQYRNAVPPQISVANIKLAGISVFEQKFEVDLRIRNPNDFALPIAGMDYVLRLDGIDFASGVNPNDSVLPAFGEQVVSISIYSNVLNSLQLIERWQKGTASSLAYEMVGNIKLKGMPVRIPFNYAGALDLSVMRAGPLRATPEEPELQIRERQKTQ